MAGSEAKHARIVGTEAKLVQKSVSWVQAAEQEAADFQPLETEDDDDDTVNRGRKNALPGTLRINCSKTAVLFIEFQNDFVHRNGELYDRIESELKRQNMLRRAKWLLQKCREQRLLVVHAPITYCREYEEQAHKFGVLYHVSEK